MHRFRLSKLIGSVLFACLLCAGAAIASPLDDAAALLKQKKFTDAEAAYRKILETSPNDVTALQGLAESLQGEGKFEEAATTFEKMADVLTKPKTAAPPAIAPAPTAQAAARAGVAQPAGGTPQAAPAPAQSQAVAPTPAPQPALTAAPDAASTDYHVGDHVEARSQGGTWYAGDVKEINGAFVTVHYGAPWNSDDIVSLDRLRKTAAAVARYIPTKIGAPAVGEIVEAKDTVGKWYKSTVLKVDGDKRFIHYEGWGDNWDEWVTPDRVRPVGSTEDPSAPANVAMPQNLTYPTTLGAPAVGEVVKAKDKQGKWYLATVLLVKGDQRFVKFQGWADNFNEWVTPDRVQPLSAKEIAAATQKRMLDGWFVKTEIAAFGGSRLICTYYWFRPDGNVYFGSPAGPVTADEFAALQKSDAKNCGTYQITGERLLLKKADGSTEEHTYSPALGGVMDNDPLSPVFRFSDGSRLDGVWSIDYSGTFGGVHSVSSNTWTFRKDGTFEHQTVGGVETTAHITGTGAAPGNAVAVDAPIEKGKYQFTGGQLKLTSDQGKSESHWAHGTDSQEKPRIFVIDGVELNSIR